MFRVEDKQEVNNPEEVKIDVITRKSNLHAYTVEQTEPTPIESYRVHVPKWQVETENHGLQEAYVDQLKENNKVLKDLMSTKNKEIIALEMQIKKDKLYKLKEVQRLKKQFQSTEETLKRYQLFVKDLLANYMEFAVPVIMDDIQVVNDCSHLLFIPDRISDFFELFKKHELLPTNFEEEIDRLKEEVEDMQDNEQEDEGEAEEEEVNQTNQFQQIVHMTEPKMSKSTNLYVGTKLTRGNSATVIMMGAKDAQKFLSSHVSKSSVINKDKCNVRYLSNVPETLKQLKSLKSFKQKGRWELMPKKDTDSSEGESNIDESEEKYYEYNDYEDQLQFDNNDIEVEESPKSEFSSKKYESEDDDDLPSTKNNTGAGGISIMNYNKFYKK